MTKTAKSEMFTVEENNILFYAFRYCLGRMTYAVDDFCQFAMANIKRICMHVLELMYEEIESARKHDGEKEHDPVLDSRLGIGFDRAEWLKLRDLIMDELKARKDKKK